MISAAHIAETMAWIIIACGVLQAALHALELAIAARALAEAPHEPHADLVWRRSARDAPPISIIAPAYDEAETVVESVRSLLALRYPDFEIIVVNDGSRDATLQTLARAFDLYRVERVYEGLLAHAPVKAVYASRLHPALIVLDKANGGKADALNAGVNFCRNPLFCCVDADSLLETDALLRAVQPFVEDPDRVVASGGTVSVANGCTIERGRVTYVGLPRSLLAVVQVLEYVRAFQLARLAWSRIGALAIISGAFGLFRRSAVVEAGGYRRDTVGEDIELVVRLHRRSRERRLDHRIVFVPEPVCWTEAPETLTGLARQRTRWQRGALETFARHWPMMTDRAYGRIGALALGRILLVDVIGPVAELAGWILLPVFCALGAVSFDFLLAFFAVNVGLGIAISLAALALQDAELSRAPRIRDVLMLSACALIENLGYRQLNALWRVLGFIHWARGRREWGDMKRHGFAARGARRLASVVR